MLRVVLAAAIAAHVAGHHARHPRHASHGKLLPGIAVVHMDGTNVRPSELGPKRGPVWRAFERIHATCSDKRYTTAPGGNRWCLVYQFKHDRTLEDAGLMLLDYQ